MYTQNTPVHIHLWHRDFWKMSIANMLLTMSVYMFMPLLPLCMMQSGHYTLQQTGEVMGIYALGLFLLGGFCTFFVERYRRNVVCMLSILALIVITAFEYYSCFFLNRRLEFSELLLFRFLQGAFFGLAQMVLCSTLIIDISESFTRTEANHSAAWFGRFALSLGPLLSLFLFTRFGVSAAMIASLVCTASSLLLIYAVKVPFRAPSDDIRLFSSDRFWLPQGIWLFINLALVTVVVGMIISAGQCQMFYAMVMCGFFFAIVAQRVVFVNAELESETITGLLSMAVGVLLLLTRHESTVMYISPALIGFGVGIIGSRFLLFFIKLSHHCERGTSQSMYMLSWEAGMASGLFVGYYLLNADVKLIYEMSLALLVFAFVMYHFFTHRWYMKHKSR